MVEKTIIPCVFANQEEVVFDVWLYETYFGIEVKSKGKTEDEIFRLMMNPVNYFPKKGWSYEQILELLRIWFVYANNEGTWASANQKQVIFENMKEIENIKNEHGCSSSAAMTKYLDSRQLLIDGGKLFMIDSFDVVTPERILDLFFKSV